MNIIEEVKNYFERNEIFDKKILLSFSCGIDSVVLMDILIKIKDDFKLNIICFYLDHGLRKEEELLKEKELIFNKLTRYKVNFFLYEFKNNQLIEKAKKENKSIEEKAREERYKLLKVLTKKYNFSYIVLGQHKNDDLETQIMRFFNSGRIKSLYGIKEKSDIYLRPLLNIKKEKIIEYAFLNKISYSQDESNYENNYLRNKIRNKLIPVIKDIFLNYEASLTNLKEDLKYLNFDCDIAKLIKLPEDIFFKIEKKDFIKLNIYYKSQIIFYCYNKLNTYYNTENKKINFSSLSILNYDFKKNTTLFNSKNLIIEYKDNYIYVFHEEIQRRKMLIYRINSDTELNIYNKKFTFSKKQYYNIKLSLSYPIIIRTFQDGDRFKNKKLKYYFEREKIPKYLRPYTILIEKNTFIYAIMFNIFGYNNLFYYNKNDIKDKIYLKYDKWEL